MWALLRFCGRRFRMPGQRVHVLEWCPLLEQIGDGGHRERNAAKSARAPGVFQQGFIIHRHTCGSSEQTLLLAASRERKKAGGGRETAFRVNATSVSPRSQDCENLTISVAEIELERLLVLIDQ
jgi:hypothetical protein